MKERTYILLSVPTDFVDKITGFIKNINILNSDSSEPVVKVENVYLKKKPQFAAVPKNYKQEEG